jgi:hypothetical protein
MNIQSSSGSIRPEPIVFTAKGNMGLKSVDWE